MNSANFQMPMLQLIAVLVFGLWVIRAALNEYIWFNQRQGRNDPGDGHGNPASALFAGFSDRAGR